MVRRRSLLLLVFLLLPFVSCTKNGEECATCSSDGDCKNTLVCSRFPDGKMRCGSGVGATICGR